MKKEKIKLKWVINGYRHEKEVGRQEFYDIMNGIRKGFSGNNEISTFLCEIIPYVSTILIDHDRNNQMENPFIMFEIDNKYEMLSIIRHHKIIWSILDGYCEE